MVKRNNMKSISHGVISFYTNAMEETKRQIINAIKIAILLSPETHKPPFGGLCTNVIF